MKFAFHFEGYRKLDSVMHRVKQAVPDKVQAAVKVVYQDNTPLLVLDVDFPTSGEGVRYMQNLSIRISPFVHVDAVEIWIQPDPTAQFMSLLAYHFSHAAV